MPSYQFSCPTCGIFDRDFTMADVPGATACPICDTPSGRRFGGAPLIRPDSALGKLIETTQRSASEPGVVSTPPPGRRPSHITRNPLHRNLPRP
ncbi:FmdB family zinc ribbon protein [Nocardia sp. NPDC051030]|uniref:FmdB family zinc ribbon protein n=1 Tax=Nocardia sp. NPDC051030 TaxID=3155162 RepID=UPI0034133F85